jgi:hypothetical protein
MLLFDLGSSKRGTWSEGRRPNPQFIVMVVSQPQRRAMGYGAPMSPAELDAWADKSVSLFLDGCRGLNVP